MLVDPAREYEKLCEVREISLRNIHQVRFISGDGQIKNGRWNDLEGTIKSALKDATWRIDPATIPDSLKPAWAAVEKGTYLPAVKDIKKALRSPNAETKKAAKSLADFVRADMKKRGSDAWALGKSGKRWEAYLALDSVCQDFQGYGVPTKLTQARDKLADTDVVKDQVRARKMLLGTNELIRSRDHRKLKQARKRLQAVLEKFPETEAAQEAKKQLEKMD